MKSAVVVFPASNCDRDAAIALEADDGAKARTWSGTHDSEVPDVDLIVLPGGFSYGDYLRCGAMANQSAVMRDVKAQGGKGRRGARHLQRFPGADRNRHCCRAP